MRYCFYCGQLIKKGESCPCRHDPAGNVSEQPGVIAEACRLDGDLSSSSKSRESGRSSNRSSVWTSSKSPAPNIATLMETAAKRQQAALETDASEAELELASSIEASPVVVEGKKSKCQARAEIAHVQHPQQDKSRNLVSRILSPFSVFFDKYFMRAEDTAKQMVSEPINKLHFVILFFLHVFAFVIFILLLARNASFGQFLPHVSIRNQALSRQAIVELCWRAATLSALDNVFRAVSLLIMLAFSGVIVPFRRILRFQRMGYIYKVAFTVFAFLFTNGSGLTGLLILCLGVAFSLMTDFLSLKQGGILNERLVFLVVTFSSILSMLFLSILLTWFFPTVMGFGIA
ncbi:MAG: hypothetical protein Q4P72_01495 [Eubacteriales bacterium]|nr:hypothetical protein [Eubacteriales bacterium]